ncbi:MAG: CBS domain-containing protein [Planctomycetota bacterium]|jgi:CBS domain-containing protein
MTNSDFTSTETAANTAVLQETPPTKARHIAKCGALTVRRDKSVYEAIGTMVKQRVSGLPVVDDTGMVGIISEKDVLRLLYDIEFLQGAVEDYMTKDVVTFDEDDSLADICACLANNNFRRVPILHEGRLAGIISRADIIRTYNLAFRLQSRAEQRSRRKKGPLAGDVMMRGLLTVRRQTPVCVAMEILATMNVTGLPVVDRDMNLVGIVTEKDMLRLLKNPHPKLGRTGDFMTEDVISFNQDDSLFDICDCLIHNNFRRVPILDQGKLIGIVSRADLIVYILKNKSVIFERRRTDMAN